MRRHGNLLPPGAGVSAVVASGKGPGPVTASVSPNAAGGADVAYAARVAGAYFISVSDAATGEALPGSPLQVA